MTIEHGGPDRGGRARWDFSTGVNALAPTDKLRERIAACDPSRYPDPAYHALRAALATRHGVEVRRILLAGSASEFIQRMTAASAHMRPGSVAVPAHAYGDYARVARAHGLWLTTRDDPRATLRWACEPSSPSGDDDPPTSIDGEAATVLDAVYEPLRLDGRSTWAPQARDAAFVLHGPNKALGLPGARGTYAIAPAAQRWQPWIDALDASAPSWPLGAHAVAMLHAWCDPGTQATLESQRSTLRKCKATFRRALHEAGFELRDSRTPFFLLRVPDAAVFTRLREQGIKLRDTTSFGLAGWARVNTLEPDAQQALLAALSTGITPRTDVTAP